LWSNINEIIYLTARPSFQATRIVASRNFNMKVERIGCKWSEFEYLCKNESCL